MTVKDFVSLNPAHNRPVISASRNNMIKIPAESLDGFLAAMEEHEKSSRSFVTWRPYTLKEGETIDRVAKRAGISANKLLSINGLSSKRRIIAGTRLLVPHNDGATDEHIAQFNAPTVVEIVDRPARYHRVQRRETLGSIGKRWG
ncbi:MAG: LysM peptidoglycan-binding domain-containing protein [Burkholderiaceae bacterium]